MSSPGKYQPLFEYLRQQPNTNLLELGFAEVEEMLGRPLPPSAQTTRAWWANNTRTAQGRAWDEANWLVDTVDFDAKTVVFRPARITYRVTPVRKAQGWTSEQIKSLREFAGWSQQELARRMSIRQQTVSDWELGLHAAHRSMGKLLQMIAEDVGYPYQVDAHKTEK
jgi:DNA-binding XRE family transcriptional regulator